MTIYIDMVLIENLIMNYIILFTTGLITKLKTRKIRMILASLLGAIYSVIAYTGIIKAYSNIVLKFILSILIVFIAYNPQKMNQLCKMLLFFYLISFVFGGAAYALIYVVKPQDIIMKNGLFLGTYPLKIIILGAIISFIVIITTFSIVRSKISRKSLFCEIELELNGKIVKTRAMIDTGNMLKEPITNTPVIVVENILLYECIPKEILYNLENIIGGDFEKVPNNIREEYISRLKLIPFSSLGKTNGMLLGIKAQHLKIIMEEQEKEIANVIIGIYDKSLTKNGEYQALVGLELL